MRLAGRRKQRLLNAQRHGLALGLELGQGQREHSMLELGLAFGSIDFMTQVPGVSDLAGCAFHVNWSSRLT